MNDIKYKILFAFAIPYLTLCAGLWHIGYWSTFDINILQHLDASDIIKAFIYPFISSVALYFIGQIFSPFLQKIFKYGGAEEAVSSKELKYGGAEEATPRKNLKFIRYFISVLIITYLILLYFFGGNDKWIWILFIIATLIGVFLNNRDFLNTVIPDRDFRLNFVYTIVLIPLLCYGVAKKKSLDIYNTSNKQTTIVSIIVNQDTASANIRYKLLGFASDFVFVMSIDNKSIIMFPKADIKQITIDKNAR